MSLLKIPFLLTPLMLQPAVNTLPDMLPFFRFLLLTLRGFVRSRAVLQLEVLELRHQLHVLARSRPRRLHLSRGDRLLWVWLSCVWTDWRSALVIVKPETVVGWHRRGFRLLWAWKSRRRGRPPVPLDARRLIRTMSEANPLWGAPRIHGELLKLGIDMCQATVAKYMVRRRPSPSQTWRTFLTNHVGQLMAADFFVVPTATCRVLFVLVILAHARRRIMHVAVTSHPTAAWTAQQLREAFPWDAAPRYLLHDRDHAFDELEATAKAMGIQEVLTAPRSPWQNGVAERFIWISPSRVSGSRHRVPRSGIGTTPQAVLRLPSTIAYPPVARQRHADPSSRHGVRR